MLEILSFYYSSPSAIFLSRLHYYWYTNGHWGVKKSNMFPLSCKPLHLMDQSWFFFQVLIPCLNLFIPINSWSSDSSHRSEALYLLKFSIQYIHICVILLFYFIFFSFLFICFLCGGSSYVNMQKSSNHS